MTTSLPYEEWTGVCGSKRITGVLPDRLTDHFHILETNGDGYHRKFSRQKTEA